MDAFPISPSVIRHRQQLLAWTRGILACLLMGGLGQTIVAEEPASSSEKPAVGTVEGVVVYRSDAERPWRLGRYYLKNAKTGELAEAVVALTNKDLKSDRPHKSQTWVVDQKDFQFTPETTAVQAGDRVKFLNSDKLLHNVQGFHLRHSFNVNMPAGGEHLETFRFAEGIRRPYRLGCVYHSAMRAWIYVFAHPWFALTGTEGVFRLEQVPPGEYQIEVVHPAGELRSQQTIQVEAGAVTKVTFELSPDDLVASK